jgi:hypothetical protein
VLKLLLLLTTDKFIHYEYDAISTVVDPRYPVAIYAQTEKYYFSSESVA